MRWINLAVKKTSLCCKKGSRFSRESGVFKVVVGKDKRHYDMMEDSWEEWMRGCKSTMEFFLANEMMYNIMSETSASSLWLKLDGLYMIVIV